MVCRLVTADGPLSVVPSVAGWQPGCLGGRWAGRSILGGVTWARHESASRVRPEAGAIQGSLSISRYRVRGALMNEAVTNVLIGAAGGFAAGLVVTVAVRMWDRLWNQRERRNQIAYIARVIAEYRALIYDVSGERAMDRDDERHLQYVEFYEDLGRVLERRTSKLAFDEIDEIDGVLVRGFRERKRKLEPQWYIETFDRAASIEWLKLKPARRDHAIFRDMESRSP